MGGRLPSSYSTSPSLGSGCPARTQARTRPTVASYLSMAKAATWTRSLLAMASSFISKSPPGTASRRQHDSPLQSFPAPAAPSQLLPVTGLACFEAGVSAREDVATDAGEG